jgi:cyanophycinase
MPSGFRGDSQSRVTNRYLGTMVEKELRALLDRGGVIGGTSAGAAVMSGVMIAGGNPRPRLVEGFDWVPDAIVDQHFSERDRRSRLEAALKTHPERWGIGIDEGTAVVVRSRRLEVLGKGSVTLMLAGWEPASTENERLVAGQVADLTAWRRAARGRTRDRFPPEELCRL